MSTQVKAYGAKYVKPLDIQRRDFGPNDIKVDITMQDINKAYERIIKADVKYRFVIDMKSLKS